MSSTAPGHKPIAATALCVHENLNYMAVGFADGSIILYKGEVTKEQSNKIKVLKNGNSIVTGLAFHTISSYTNLFVATESNVYLYNISIKDKVKKFHLDDVGCAKNCSVLVESVQGSNFMIARNDAIYCYTTDGRGPCYAVDGLKIMLRGFHSYLVIVAKNTKSVTPFKSHESAATNDHDLEKHIVTVLDIQNKFIIFSASLQEVQAVVTEWGAFFFLGRDRKLYHLQEKDLQSKLALLFKKNLYDLSIRVMRNQNYDSEVLVDIFRKYGDYLYSMGDHSAAIEQYIKTIGNLEPSYIIRKFLDSQHIDKLTTYLQALHKQCVATEDHTTLLINCFIKQNDTEKLKEFVMTEAYELDFDVEVVIKVCRQASSDVASLLARKHGLHDWYLKIEIEDGKKYREALKYISCLEFEEAEKNMKKYGNILIEHVPCEATQFLKKLCVDYKPNNKPIVGQCVLEKRCANPEDFIQFFNNSDRLVDFLEYLIMVKPKCGTLVYNTIIEHYLRIWASQKDPSTKQQYEQKVMWLLQNSKAIYDKDQFLILCQMYDFKNGILHVYEENKLYQQIVQYHIKQQDYKSALTTYRHFAHQDPSLWVQALWLCVKDPHMPSCFLTEVLGEVEKERLLTPLLVVDALSKSSSVTLGEVRNYLLSVLQFENKLIEKELELIDSYRQESKRAWIQIEMILTGTIIFQGSRCNVCHLQLQLPSVHFLCHHLYHQDCFQSVAENSNECPVCFSENKTLLDVIKSKEQNENLYETFHNELENAEDCFSVVGEYFGRGVFDKLNAFTDFATMERITRDLNLGKRTITNLSACRPGAETQLKFMRTSANTEMQFILDDRVKLEKNHVSSCSSLELNLSQAKSELSALQTSPSAQDSPVCILQAKGLHSSPMFTQTMLPRSKYQVMAANPFEDEYDESKNPFAENNANTFAENNVEEENDMLKL